MYTLSGVSVGAGIAVAPALVIARQKSEYSKEELFTFDSESEIDRYIKKSSQFAQKLRQIRSEEHTSEIQPKTQYVIF